LSQAGIRLDIVPLPRSCLMGTVCLGRQQPETALPRHSVQGHCHDTNQTGTAAAFLQLEIIAVVQGG
jgi:hypothetical protein